MGTVDFFENLFLNSSKWIRKTLVTYGEYKNINRKKKLVNSVTMTKVQKDEIDAFYKKHYGKKISTKWHKLYQSYTGEYRYNYFPEILLSSKLEPLTNPYRKAIFLGDKNLLHCFFGDIKGLHIPNTFISCVNGVIRNQNNILIDFEQAVNNLQNLGACVIKKTTDTNSGRDVMICNIVNGYDKKSGHSVKNLLELFGDNYVVQEKIDQSPVLKEFNASCLNTFRIITYVLDDKIKLCPIALRLGRNSAEKDNIHYGGISVGVGIDGKLKDYAYSEYGDKFDAHPDSKVYFKNKVIPQVTDLVEKAKELHQHMPYLGIISWDLSLDSDNIPVLIEMNTTGQSAWFPQMINGEPLFGDDTGKMLEKIRV